MPTDFLTIKEAAEVLEVTPRQLRRIINSGRLNVEREPIEAFKILIPRDELLRYKECRWQRNHDNSD